MRPGHWLTAIAALLVIAFGLFGVLVMARSKLDDYIRYDSIIESAEMWYGKEQPDPIGGKNQLDTPHLWIKLEGDAAYFLLATVDNQDKDVQAQLHPGDQVTIYYGFAQTEGAYPVKQLEREGQVLFSIEDDNSGSRVMGLVFVGIGVLLMIIPVRAAVRSSPRVRSSGS